MDKTEPRYIVVVVHSGRKTEAVTSAAEVLSTLLEHGVTPVLEPEDFDLLTSTVPELTQHVKSTTDINLTQAELCIVLGGDGTILRAAETVREANLPILGINLGHVGFLAEIEQEELDAAIVRVLEGDYSVEERVVIQVRIIQKGEEDIISWALNEAVIEKSSPEKMLEVLVEVDGQPVSSYGADGVLVSTPTGSTAYAFSSGGPILWPDLEALLIVPLNAHALFSRPLVLSPRSKIVVQLLARNQSDAVVWLDGRRGYQIRPGARVESSRSEKMVRLARLNPSSFAERLVKKFNLPISGWRDSNTQTSQIDIQAIEEGQ